MRRRTLLNSSGTIGGYEFVDLGLPSGLLWATCNVGATKESDYGNYYQWGAGSIPHQDSFQYNYYTGSTSPLPSTYDTATQVMGEGWRMPTRAEFQDLTAKTNYEYAFINGIGGAKFTSKTNPNAYVFFPGAGYRSNNNGNLEMAGNGYIWSSTSYSIGNAYFLVFDSEETYPTITDIRMGQSVRGVHAAV